MTDNWRARIRYDEQIEANKEGRGARRQGEPQSANPHPWGTAERRLWNQGWRGAGVQVDPAAPRCIDCGIQVGDFDCEFVGVERVYRCATCRAAPRLPQTVVQR